MRWQRKKQSHSPCEPNPVHPPKRKSCNWLSHTSCTHIYHIYPNKITSLTTPPHNLQFSVKHLYRTRVTLYTIFQMIKYKKNFILYASQNQIEGLFSSSEHTALNWGRSVHNETGKDMHRSVHGPKAGAMKHHIKTSVRISSVPALAGTRQSPKSSQKHNCFSWLAWCGW